MKKYLGMDMWTNLEVQFLIKVLHYNTLANLQICSMLSRPISQLKKLSGSQLPSVIVK